MDREATRLEKALSSGLALLLIMFLIWGGSLLVR